MDDNIEKISGIKRSSFEDRANYWESLYWENKDVSYERINTLLKQNKRLSKGIKEGIKMLSPVWSEHENIREHLTKLLKTSKETTK